MTAGDVSATIGTGGDIDILAGDGIGTGSGQRGGDIDIRAGAVSGSGTAPGNATLEAGSSTASTEGGQALLLGGQGVGGGLATVQGGPGTAGGAGGIVEILGGIGQGTGGGGGIQLTAGASGAGVTGNGGALTLTGGASLATDGAGGDLTLTSGAGNGTGADGDVIIFTDVVEAMRFAGDGTDVIISNEANVGLTAAGSPSTQGSGVITSSYNVYSTVANVADAITLPATFIVGTQIWIKNDDATESLDVWPASGDDAGAGTDTAIALAAGSTALFLGTVVDTTWTQLI